MGLEGETRICGALSLRGSPCFLHYSVALLIRERALVRKTRLVRGAEMRGVTNPARRNALFAEDMSNGECCVFEILSSFSGSIFRRPNGASGQINLDRPRACVSNVRIFERVSSANVRIAHLCSNLHLNLLH